MAPQKSKVRKTAPKKAKASKNKDRVGITKAGLSETGDKWCRAAALILEYFNLYMTPGTKNSHRASVRRWCKEYYKRDWRSIHLHEHEAVPIKPKDENAPVICKPLGKDAPDNPWLLYHPDAFDVSLPPMERFNPDRYNTHPFRLPLLADCLTARRLSDVEVLECNGAIENCDGLSTNDFLGLRVDQPYITAQNLVHDQAIICYLPEFMVWLGHSQKNRADVHVSAEQQNLYRQIASTLAARMQHFRVAQSYFAHNGLPLKDVKVLDD